VIIHGPGFPGTRPGPTPANDSARFRAGAVGGRGTDARRCLIVPGCDPNVRRPLDGRAPGRPRARRAWGPLPRHGGGPRAAPRGPTGAHGAAGGGAGGARGPPWARVPGGGRRSPSRNREILPGYFRPESGRKSPRGARPDRRGRTPDCAGLPGRGHSGPARATESRADRAGHHARRAHSSSAPAGARPCPASGATDRRHARKHHAERQRAFGLCPRRSSPPETFHGVTCASRNVDALTPPVPGGSILGPRESPHAAHRYGHAEPGRDRAEEEPTTGVRSARGRIRVAQAIAPRPRPGRAERADFPAHSPRRSRI
jgi:hypothetical protein